MFHVPPDLVWDVDSIQRSFQSLGLNSRVDGESVVLEFPRTGANRYVLRLLDFFVSRFRSTLRIEHRRDCAIGSVNLHCHPSIPFAVAIRHVEGVMRDHGFVQIGTEATVREIAISLSSSDIELQKTLDEYDSHQAKYTRESPNEWAIERDLILARTEALLVNAAIQ
ncbi:hypothetical protein [Novipirellula sp.]|uniref:hypothetical protein n=1 Tax=Novipirellula sp. TaxID=2795430 RepID=UPI00356145C6